MKDAKEIWKRYQGVQPNPWGYWYSKEEKRVYNVKYIGVKELEGKEVVILDIEKVWSDRYNRECVEVLVECEGNLYGVVTSARVFLENFEEIRRGIPLRGVVRCSQGGVEVKHTNDCCGKR